MSGSAPVSSTRAITPAPRPSQTPPAWSRRAVLERLTPDDVRRLYASLGVEHFGPGGRDNWLTRSPLRPDAHPSFTIRKHDGVWRDNASGEAGSLFDAVMRVRGCDFRAALAYVAETVGGNREQGTGNSGIGSGERSWQVASQPTVPCSLFPVPSSVPSKVVATYPYTDAAGQLLYEILRLEPKSFRARRPATPAEPSRDGWVWSLRDVPRVLYQLGELLGAAPDEWIFIPEGEKDVDRLRALGLTATTNPGGAGKWQAGFSDVLRGRHVVALPDHDEPGRAHAALIARALQGVAASVRVVTLPGLPPGGDVSDWLAAGGTAARLVALAEAARPIVLTADAPTAPAALAGLAAPAAPAAPIALLTRLSEVRPKPVDWLWERWLPRGKLSILGGHPGVGKSTLAAALAALLSSGAPWPDAVAIDTPDGAVAAPPGNALFLLAEDAVDDTLRPRLDQLGADVTRIHALDAVRAADGSETMLNLAQHLPLLEQALERHAIDLVVIDPLSAFLPNSNRNDEGDMRDLLTPLGRLAERRHVAILGIMHVGKPSAARRTALQSLLGATAFGAFARAVLMCAALPDSERAVLAVVKSNLARTPTPLEWSRPEDGALVWHGPTTHDVDALLGGLPGVVASGARGDAADAFLRAALAAGPRRVAELLEEADAEGITRKLLRTARETLGVEVSKEKGVEHGGWWWSLPSNTAQPSGEGKMPAAIDTQQGILTQLCVRTTNGQDAQLTSCGAGQPHDGSNGQDAQLDILGNGHLDLAAEPTPSPPAPVTPAPISAPAAPVAEPAFGCDGCAPSVGPRCWQCEALLTTPEELAFATCAACRPAR